MQTLEVETEDGIYVIRKSFVDEINKMSRSRFSLLGRNFVITPDMIVKLSIEENMIIGRMDK
jgi:hypothetical protein